LRETAVEDNEMEEPKMNPNNPNLPELKGTLIGTALNQQEEKRRKEASREEYDDSAIVGWVGND
jgi:hypothetical protein